MAARTRRKKDITGKRFGKLTVTGQAESKDRWGRWFMADRAKTRAR